MKPTDDKEQTVTIRSVSSDEEGRKRVQRMELKTHSIDTAKHVEKKLVEKGVQRLDRHSADDKSGVARPPPKSGHGGKFTWEGPTGVAECQLAPAPPAIDRNDPNYIDEVAEDGGDVAAELVVGEVEVAKVAESREGVTRVEVDPNLSKLV